MRGTIFVVLVALATLAKADEYGQILKQKITSSIPNVDSNSFNSLTSNVVQAGKRFHETISRNNLDSVMQKTYKARVPGGYNIKVWSDFNALKWGTKFEHLESHKRIVGTGEKSWTVVIGKIGSRTDDSVNMRTFAGWATCNTRRQVRSISYRECKRYLFIKRCKTRHRDVERGLTIPEMMTIENGLARSAHQGAVDGAEPASGNNVGRRRRINSSLQNFVNATKQIGGRHFRGTAVTEVPRNSLNKVISSIGHGRTSRHVANAVNGVIEHPRSMSLDLATPQGKRMKISLQWNQKRNRFTVMSSR